MPLADVSLVDILLSLLLPQAVMLKDYVTGVYSTVEGMKYFYNAKNTKNAGKLNIFMASEPDHIDPALNSTVDGGCLAVNSFEGLMRYNAGQA